MPENAEYIRYSYNGNAAYEAAPQWSEEEERVQAPQPNLKPKGQTSYHVSLFAIVGYAVVVVLIVAMLMAYVNYTAAAAEMMKYKTKIETLEQENKKLTVAYERSFDMLELESYARGVLCMDKPVENQITNLTTETTDTAIVYDSGLGGESVLEEILTFFESLTEYLG